MVQIESQSFGSHVYGPQYILNDSDFEDDGEVNGDEGVIDIGLIGTMEEVVLPTNEVKAFDDLESLNVPWKEH
jgi:hypothetical protein